MESLMREKSSLNILSKEPRWSCSETNNFGVFPFKQSMFLFLREIEKASLLIIIRGVKFLKVFQIVNIAGEVARLYKYWIMLSSIGPESDH